MTDIAARLRYYGEDEAELSHLAVFGPVIPDALTPGQPMRKLTMEEFLPPVEYFGNIQLEQDPADSARIIINVLH